MNEFEKQLTPWKIFALVLLALQFIASFMVSIMILRVNMLTAPIVAAIIVLFILLLAVDLFLLYLSQEKKQSTVRKVIGTVIAVITIICCLWATMALDKLLKTVNAVTQISKVDTDQINIYVLTDDPAQNIIDAADYTFGYTTVYDYENTQTTLEEIAANIAKTPTTEAYDSVFTMIDGLYDGSCGAIILNEAYVDILEDVEGYTDFSEKTRILDNYVIQTETPEVVINEVEEEDPVNENVFTVFISGSDTRDKTLTRSRSDVNILAVVNTETKQILLINTPRDYYVEISVGNGEEDKLTHCGIYGTHCSMDTLGNLYDVDVQDYAQINFTGFEKLVNAIGGVSVYSDADFDCGYYHFKEGYNDVNGAQALAFARERHAFADGDNARGRHQMALITAIIKKITGSTTLISNYSDIMDSLEGMFSTSVSSKRISEMVKLQLSDGTTWDIRSYAVTGSNGTSSTTYSMPGTSVYVMIPDQDSVDKAKTLIEKLENNELITDEDLQ